MKCLILEQGLGGDEAESSTPAGAMMIVRLLIRQWCSAACGADELPRRCVRGDYCVTNKTTSKINRVYRRHLVPTRYFEIPLFC